MTVQIIRAIYHDDVLLTPGTVIDVKDRIGNDLIGTGAGIAYEQPFTDEDDLNYETD